MSLERFSEETGPCGGITADGMLNVLGSPPFDRLTLVLREAAQNGWDARTARWIDEAIVPELHVRIRTLAPEQEVAFRRLFSDQGTQPVAANELAHRLSSKRPIRVLEICDFGTVGLRGPVDPRQPLDGLPNNFRNFFFDVGVAHPKSADGGTYGYGRSSLYLASSARTILVDTLALEPDAVDGVERRFLACRIGHAYERSSFLGAGARYTGRHFWGRRGDGIIAPVVQQDAAEIASSLGMPLRERSQSGTTILVPWPEADAEPISGRALVDILLHHLWPKMVSERGPRAMRFRVEEEGTVVPIPQVSTHPIFGLYASALLVARDRSVASGAREIRLQRPDVVTGHLGLEVGTASTELAQADEPEDSRFRSPTAGGSWHVALMRPSELVVRYLEVANARVDRKSWAGVFLCVADSEIQNAFAESEPPAHDDWIPHRLEDKSARRLVNRTVSYLIPQAVRDAFGTTRTTTGAGSAGPSLAAAADAFSRQFLSGDGSGVGPAGGRAGGGGSGGGPRRQARLLGPELEGLRFDARQRIATFRIRVAGLDRESVLVEARPTVATDGPVHTAELPAEISLPEVLGWRGLEGEYRARGTAVRVDRDGDLLVDVAFRGDYALSLTCGIREVR